MVTAEQDPQFLDDDGCPQEAAIGTKRIRVVLIDHIFDP